MIAAALKVSVHQVDNTLSLLDGGATIPFISRYRKEATGGLDEVQIGEIKDRNDKLCELAKRKETILSTIEEQGKLTPEVMMIVIVPYVTSLCCLSLSLQYFILLSAHIFSHSC